ncbi:MAG: hypothetical protein ACD_22C00127G0001 [uncultured bacterium]|nr:MAG: hypothetical protein ACD_22C00127G0001 [uncultured bacterium]
MLHENLILPASEGVNSITFSPKLKYFLIPSCEENILAAQVLASVEVITHLTGTPFLIVKDLGEYPL